MKAFKRHPTEAVNYPEQFRVKQGHRIRLKEIDPQFANKEEEKKSAKRAIKKLQKRMNPIARAVQIPQLRGCFILGQCRRLHTGINQRNLFFWRDCV
jgi:hypothetical protein